MRSSGELKIEPGQTTRDGQFSLEVVACIGACGLAPVICVNGEFHAGVTTKKVGKILDSYRKKASQHDGNEATEPPAPSRAAFLDRGRTRRRRTPRSAAIAPSAWRNCAATASRRPTIFVGAGTCGLGAGAKETLGRHPRLPG